ncbi:MAG TPA: LuxR C-terminal-related transcriptional regulator [Slackia equolifaciens]|uniref:LuxR C-terminal-related transcriptional regulator n=1 Tax=Slackia equolifaciens TaxID=498718 RepID=A0A9D2UV69_9ACTN|nr:LuxR C-terminal-related transcriptional regulator [Slackia equolifaciens]
MTHRPNTSAPCSIYAAVGLTLVFVWSSLTDHMFSLHESLPESLGINPRAFFLAGILILSVAFAVFPHHLRAKDASLKVLFPFAGAVGTACIAIAPNQSLFHPGLLCATGLACLGLGYCWLSVRYGLLLARSTSTSRIVYCIGAGLIMEPIVRLLIESAFTQAVSMGIAIALPIAAMLPLHLVHRMIDKEAGSAEGLPDSHASAKRLKGDIQEAHFANVHPQKAPQLGKVDTARQEKQRFVLLLATALLLATVRTLSPVGTWDADFDPAPMTSSPALWAFYAISVALYARFDLANVESTPSLGRFQPAFLLVVLTELASFVLLSTQGSQSAVLYTFMCLNDTFAHLLFWTSIAHTVRQLDLPPYRIVGLAAGVYAAASIGWLFLLGESDTLQALVTITAIAALYVLTIVMVNTSGNDRAMAIGGMEDSQAHASSEHINGAKIDPENSPALADRVSASIEERCQQIAKDYGLSPRETEVFTLLAQGRTRPYIQDELVLAENTVKTHIAHIYKKLGIGSRQDIFDLVLAKSDDENRG